MTWYPTHAAKAYGAKANTISMARPYASARVLSSGTPPETVTGRP